MLGTLMGRDKVVVSVTADIDFSQENREENLVTPVDEENMAGIAISAQKITETYTGNGNQAGGTVQAENAADALGSQYLEGNTNNGDYEKVDDTINYEVNRIRKEIVESPYKIRDLGIQVMVEPPEAEKANSLPQERVNDITNMLATIVRTSIDKNANPQLTDQDINQKIAVSVQPFKGKVSFDNQITTKIPWWIYLIVGVLVAIIGVLVFVFIRARRNQDDSLIEDNEIFEQPIDIPDVNESHETESSLRRKQLEKLAKEKPEEFAKLLRSWSEGD